ncbi:hypothetical protein Taro_038590 [Colocasia esculenta]|uniref:PWWP domain-containing protein n=1 Tax=Colocasia esculenta TaxID=4460 RepID=A0A843WP39_COLES|nr:hypothetical protein [Colocasia esculenta]
MVLRLETPKTPCWWTYNKEEEEELYCDNNFEHRLGNGNDVTAGWPPARPLRAFFCGFLCRRYSREPNGPANCWRGHSSHVAASLLMPRSFFHSPPSVLLSPLRPFCLPTTTRSLSLSVWTWGLGLGESPPFAGAAAPFVTRPPWTGVASPCSPFTYPHPAGNPGARGHAPALALLECSIARDAAQLQGAEVEPAVKNSLFAAYNSSCPSQHGGIPHSSNLSAERLSAIPMKSIVKVTGSLKSHLAPGSVVWAKIGYHEWWPAEVMDKRAALERSNDEWDERLVLIQLYGCYEERSKDTSKAFQDALNQALRRKETTSSSEQSDENSGRSNMLNCHGASDDPINEGNGKRRWKPKVRFDYIIYDLFSFDDIPAWIVRSGWDKLMDDCDRVV